MRLLVINPNISADVSELIGAEANRTASAGTDVVVRTAASGVEYVETGFEALLAGVAVAEIVAEHADADAVVVAAFGDPGMPALKELTDVPVVGITEAALCVAALQGQRFAIIAISERIGSWYRDCVERFGLSGRLVAIRSLRSVLPDIATVQADFGPALVDLARQAVSEDGADVIILAGAPLAGLARDVAGQIPVPVVDGIAAGVAMAESLTRLVTHRALTGAAAPPPVKRRVGLSPALDVALDRVQHSTPEGELS